MKYIALILIMTFLKHKYLHLILKIIEEYIQIKKQEISYVRLTVYVFFSFLSVCY